MYNFRIYNSQGVNNGRNIKSLHDNARLSSEDIAAMTKVSCGVDEIIAKLEADGIIIKYSAVVNPENLRQQRQSSSRN